MAQECYCQGNATQHPKADLWACSHIMQLIVGGPYAVYCMITACPAGVACGGTMSLPTCNRRECCATCNMTGRITLSGTQQYQQLSMQVAIRKRWTLAVKMPCRCWTLKAGTVATISQSHKLFTTIARRYRQRVRSRLTSCFCLTKPIRYLCSATSVTSVSFALVALHESLRRSHQCRGDSWRLVRY